VGLAAAIVVVTGVGVTAALLAGGDADSNDVTSGRGGRGRGSTSTTGPTTDTPTTTPADPDAPNGQITYDVSSWKKAASGADPQCADWTVRLTNGSDTEIVQFTWDPPAAHYAAGTFPDEEGYEEWPAEDPSAAIVDLSVPAFESRVVSFTSCTVTPVPVFFAHLEPQLVPSVFTWKWATGVEGSSCFGGYFREPCTEL
jgi:hypothetical protein